jgi:pyruvate formate lyase activating enzyme
MIQAKYFKKDGTKILCLLCPHRCAITLNRSGICGVRKNENSDMVLPYAGILSAVSIDPIEKKPLYHFHPGKPIYSIGFFGCNFRCPFCQNYTISQELPVLKKKQVSPREVVQEACNNSSFAVAYTYSEPLIHFEFVLETSILARKAGLKNVLI